MYETSFKLTDHTIRESIHALRMKTFTDHDPAVVENRINEWLSSHDVQIRYVGQSQSEKSGRFVFTISLFYSGN
jgi:hypothetical protein